MLRAAYPRVATLCRRMTGNDADAADATQEALIAIARGLPRFDGRSRATTWMYRVATNACLDELRRRRRRPDPMTPEDLPAATVMPASVADDAARRIDVRDALAQLPVEFRAAVVLRDLCGLDYAEISDVLGVPAGTVRSRISRGRQAVAGLLGNHESASERPTTSP